MKRNVAKGTESNIFHIFIQDSSQTDGSGLTGLAWDTGSLTAYYIREGAATPVEITLATIAVIGTYEMGGFKEVDATNLPGVYEFDPPDTAFVTGSEAVVFMLKGASNMAVIPLEIQLIDAPATAAALTAHNANLVVVDGNVDDILEDTVLVDKWLKNKIEFDGTTMTLYDDNGTDILLTWTLSSGNISVVGPYNRAKAT